MSDFVHTIVATIEDSPKSKWGRKLVFVDENNFRFMLLRYNPGSKILIGLKNYKEKHSPQQRGYLRGVVVPEILRAIPMEESKENNDLMYYKLKEKFGPCEIKFGKDGESGEALVFPKSARDMDTADMSQIIDGAIRWAGEFLGITITPPNRVISGVDGAGI